MSQHILTSGWQWPTHVQQELLHLLTCLIPGNNKDRTHDQGRKSPVVHCEGQAWVEGTKALPNFAINESASASHLALVVCVLDSTPSYPVPPKDHHEWLRARAT